MRVHGFEVKNYGPLKLVSVKGLSNVVVLAGPNGVGKTSINNALLELARKPRPNSALWAIVEATNEEEERRWKKHFLDTRHAEDAVVLRTHLQRNQRRNKYQGSFLNFDSDRAIRNVQQYSFSWDIGNPFAEDINWDVGFQSLHNRYNDVRHSLFRVVESQRREIADTVLSLQNSGATDMELKFPDVIKPFKEAFWQLLAPKKLVEVSVKNQQIYYEHQGAKLSIDSLSSGEREVVNIVFDFLLRGPQHCVVLFDEPELHLHPELSYKLLQTLSVIGEANQFVFSTHSPEIISASLENTVIFVTPARSESDNQAVIVHQNDETHHALQTLGQSIGVISLGKKLVLIEGEETSLDKQTYGAILQSRFPEFVLVPVGGKDTIRSFEDIRDSILNKTLWGVEFYLLCDRDAVNVLGKNAVATNDHTKVKLLPRYHLENYFLDVEAIALVFADMEPADSWLRDRSALTSKLREIAKAVIPYATALNVAATIREKVGNVSLMPKGIAAIQTCEQLVDLILRRIEAESMRVAAGLDEHTVRNLILQEHSRLTDAVSSDSEIWRRDLPGRVILNRFSSAANIHVGRLKQLYLAKADKSRVFGEIISIFEGFRQGR